MRRWLTWTGILCLTTGLMAGGYVGYRILDPFAGARQHALQQQLQHDWGKPPSRAAVTASCVPGPLHPALGQPFALIQIPAFGSGWKFAVVQGTDLPQLALGPGHVPGTAYPGQPGNTGIAGHDVTAGNSFLRLTSLRPGDKIIITMKDCVVTYAVDRMPFTVRYTDIAVLRSEGQKHTIVLITCTPVNVLYFVPNRTIVHATEVSSVPR